MNCSELEALRDLVPLGVLDASDAALVAAHVAGCSPCEEKSRALASAYATLDASFVEEARPLPVSLREGLVAAALEPVSGGAAPVKPAEPIRLSLRCSFCHGELARGACAYCASCLAPHHADCFREHGRCSAFGCGETRLVPPGATVEAARPRPVPARPRRPSLRWAVAACLLVATSVSLLGVKFQLEKVRATYDQKVAPVDVPIATRDLGAGDVVARADITIQQFPHDVIDAVGGSCYLASDTDRIEGAKIVIPIKQGQIFQSYHFRRPR